VSEEDGCHEVLPVPTRRWVVVCDTCGAQVIDRPTHRAWHAKVDPS